MEEGSLEEAVDSFKRGMTSLKLVIEDYVRSKRKRAWYRTLQTRSETEQRRPQPILVDTTQQRNVESHVDSPDLFVFQCPLRITQEDVAFPESYAEISLILTYNLALVYHLTATRNEMKDEDRLRKALDLYSMALDLVLRDKAMNSSVVILVAAILNNMGIAYSLLGDTEHCKKFFKRMLSILMIELAANRSHQLANHVDGFFWNINYFIYEKPTAAAA